MGEKFEKVLKALAELVADYLPESSSSDGDLTSDQESQVEKIIDDRLDTVDLSDHVIGEIENIDFRDYVEVLDENDIKDMIKDYLRDEFEIGDAIRRAVNNGYLEFKVTSEVEVSY